MKVETLVGKLKHREVKPLDLVLIGLPDRLVRNIERLVVPYGRCHVTDLRMLSTVLLRMPNVVCMLAVPTSEDLALLDHVRSTREQFPKVGLLAVFIPASSSHAQLMRIGAEGVNDVLVYADDLTAILLWERLRSVSSDSVAFQLGRMCQGVLPDPWVTVFKAALRLAHSPITLARLAASAGMHERTLRKYCDKHVIPSPQWIIGWSRLLTAAYYLSEPGRTLSSVADLLGYPSTSALQNQIRRYTGRGPRELRANGALSGLLAALAMLATSQHCTNESERPTLRLLR
jgi:AraC-like DNA-binding protein